ncbi:hypothetical protein HCU01_26630 [Halomonas cupida]|uniref:Uncharacterized protein n=1 Tax=Halomonas cupida TaxID=44933 RepID=A0ABQ0WG69_9GAMM|nr:hypothetical protein HCU01_26630 [Halomonas cupida]
MFDVGRPLLVAGIDQIGKTIAHMSSGIGDPERAGGRTEKEGSVEVESTANASHRSIPYAGINRIRFHGTSAVCIPYVLFLYIGRRPAPSQPD